MCKTEIFVILDRFLPFQPLTTQKIKILKLEKIPEDIINLHICNINDNSMMYGSWDKKHKEQNFCHFGPFFALLPPQPEKSKFWKTEKNTLRYHHFTQVYQKLWSYAILFLRCNRCNCYFPFWTIFFPLPS